VTFTNTGVTSATAGAGINVSGGTGAVTFTNAGVTSIVAGPNVSISGSTGAVTISASNSGGTVTSITAGSGLTGGTITSSGTIAVSTTLAGVGTYAFLYLTPNVANPGDNVTSTGNNLFYSNTNGDSYNYPSGIPSGQVWRCLGYGNNSPTLYIRIS
jgi:hypothetical protein